MPSPEQIKDQKISPAALRTALGRAFWAIAEHYGLTQREQSTLLGVKFNKARLIAMRTKRMIPDDPDKQLRVSYLLGIHKNLRILLPNNRELVYHWFKTARPEFAGKSAMKFTDEGGIEALPRLAMVRRYLDSFGGVSFSLKHETPPIPERAR